MWFWFLVIQVLCEECDWSWGIPGSINKHISEDNRRTLNENTKRRNLIVEGHSAEIGEYPWHVELKHGCGGTLIGREWILTAAHCYDDHGRLEYRMNAEIYFKHAGLTVSPKRVYIHPDFDLKTLENDIALIRIDPLDCNLQGIRPIKLLKSVAFNFNGCTAFIQGYGNLWEEGPEPAHLQELITTAYSATHCKQIFKLYGETVEDSQFCAYSDLYTEDSCQGDSGGSLLIDVNESENEHEYLVTGIVSYGEGCGKYPGVYTDVGYYQDWILSNYADAPFVRPNACDEEYFHEGPTPSGQDEDLPPYTQQPIVTDYDLDECAISVAGQPGYAASPACADPNCAVCGPQGTTDWDCIICKEGYEVQVGKTDVCAGACVPYGESESLQSKELCEMYIPCLFPSPCENIVNLDNENTPYTGTTSRSSSYLQHSCGGSGNENVFKITVPPLYNVQFKELSSSHDSVRSIRTGGECPGDFEVVCADEPDDEVLLYANTGNEDAIVYFVMDGFDRAHGDFSFTWEIIFRDPPTANPTVLPSNAPTAPTATPTDSPTFQEFNRYLSDGSVCSDYQGCRHYTQEECQEEYRDVIIGFYKNADHMPTGCIFVTDTEVSYFNTYAEIERPGTETRNTICFCENTDERVGQELYGDGDCAFVTSQWIGVMTLNQCRESIRHDINCSSEFFKHATDGDGNCGCMDLSRDVESCNIQSSPYGVKTYIVTFSTEGIYELAIANKVCNFHIWLGVFAEDKSTCRFVVMHDEECTKSYFMYNRKTTECGCLFIDNDCTAPWNHGHSQDVDIYAITGITNPPTVSPTKNPTFTSPSTFPSTSPIIPPSLQPTNFPLTSSPTFGPTTSPTTTEPSNFPTETPTTPAPSTSPTINLHSSIVIQTDHICLENTWMPERFDDAFGCMKYVLQFEDCADGFFNYSPESQECGCVGRFDSCWFITNRMKYNGANVYVIITQSTTTLSPTTSPTSAPTNVPTLQPTFTPSLMPTTSVPSQAPSRFYAFYTVQRAAICKPYKWLDVYDKDPNICMDVVKATPGCGSRFFSHATLSDFNCGCVWQSFNTDCTDPLNWQANSKVMIYAIGIATAKPTLNPTGAPSPAPTHEPTRGPSPAPTREPTDKPTPAPTDPPTLRNVCPFGTQQEQLECLRLTTSGLDSHVDALQQEVATIELGISAACDKARSDLEDHIATCSLNN